MDPYVRRTLHFFDDNGTTRRIDETELATTRKPLVILAEPGMGKTWLLRGLAKLPNHVLSTSPTATCSCSVHKSLLRSVDGQIAIGIMTPSIPFPASCTCSTYQRTCLKSVSLGAGRPPDRGHSLPRAFGSGGPALSSVSWSADPLHWSSRSLLMSCSRRGFERLVKSLEFCAIFCRYRHALRPLPG